MKAAVFERLERVLGAVRTAEQARLAEVLARSRRCQERAQRLRAQAGAGGAEPMDAATLLAAANWRARLLREADAEEERARGLEQESEPFRRSLAAALGRERAAGILAERARDEARRTAAWRAEAAVVPLGQPSPSSPDISSGCTGSPGIA